MNIASPVVSNPDPAAAEAARKAALARPLAAMTPAELADHYGDLDLEVKRFEPARKRYEALKTLIKGMYAASPATATATAEGTRWDIQVSAQGKERKWISMPKVARAVGGIKRFYELCTIAIAAVEDEIGKSRTESLLLEEQTGSRRLTAVLRATPPRVA